MKLKPLKVDVKAVIAFQREYEEKWGKDFDIISHLENAIIVNKNISKRKYKINKIFK